MRLINADKLSYHVQCEGNPYGKPTIKFEDCKAMLNLIDKEETVNPFKEVMDLLDVEFKDVEGISQLSYSEFQMLMKAKDIVKEVMNKYEIN